MAHRRSFGRGRGVSQTQRRKKTWLQTASLVDAAVNPGLVNSIGIQVTAPGVAGFANRAILLLAFGDGTAGSQLVSGLPDESTILRMRGSLLFPKTTFDATAVIQTEFAFGIGVTGLSSATSSGSYPGVITDASWDGWMFKRESALGPFDSNATMMDIKAMRKMQSGDALFVSVEAANGLAPMADIGQWIFDLRILVLLP